MSPPGRPQGEYRSATHEGAPMNAALQTQVAMMLRAPWQWQRNDGRLWAFWLYLGLAVLLTGAASVAALVWMPRTVAWAVGGVLGTCGLLALWGVQFSALLRLDHPHAARFVVGYGRALRAAAMAVWLVMLTFAAVVAALVQDLPGGGTARLLVAAMIAGATLLYVAMALRWWVLWVVIWFVFLLFDQAWVRAGVRPLMDFLRDHWQAQPLLWTGLVLVALATALVNLFGRADATHTRTYARRESFRKIASAGAAGRKPALAAYGRWGELLGAPFRHLADAWLAHVTRRACPERASVMARAEVVLHGAQHWVGQLGSMVVVQLVVLSALYVLMRSVAPDLPKPWAGAQVGMGIGLASMAIAPLISLPAALWGSRREQALLVLLPGMPQGAALNRALAWQQMTHFARVWVAALPALVAVAWWSNSLLVWAFAAAALPPSVLLCRDVSRLRAPGARVALLFVLFTGLCVVSLLLDRWQSALLLPWALGMVLLTAALLAWRWRKLAHWPPALPAGRLA